MHARSSSSHCSVCCDLLLGCHCSESHAHLLLLLLLLRNPLPPLLYELVQLSPTVPHALDEPLLHFSRPAPPGSLSSRLAEAPFQSGLDPRLLRIMDKPRRLGMGGRGPRPYHATARHRQVSKSGYGGLFSRSPTLAMPCRNTSRCAGRARTARRSQRPLRARCSHLLTQQEDPDRGPYELPKPT